MIKLPRHDYTTEIGADDRNRKRKIIKWGQEFPCVSDIRWRNWKRIWRHYNPAWELILGLRDQTAPVPR